MRGRPFARGQSGNPGGRPKIVAELRTLAREHTATAIGTLIAVMTNTKSPAAARVAAANSILDRAFGRPPTLPPPSVNFDPTFPLESHGAADDDEYVEF